MNSQYLNNEAKWDQYRYLITQLYYRDGLNLNRLIEKMKNERQFKATPKMYKTKITAWGLTKYVKHVGSTRVQKRETMPRALIAATGSDAALQSRYYGNLAALPGVEFVSVHVDAGLSKPKLANALSDTILAPSSLRRITAPEKMLFLSRDYLSYHKKLRTAFCDYAGFLYGYQTEIDQSLVAVRKAKFQQANIHWRKTFDIFENMLIWRDCMERLMSNFVLLIQWLILALGDLVNGGIVEVAFALQRHLARVASIKQPPKHHHRLWLEVLTGLDPHMMDWLCHTLNRVARSVHLV